MGIGIDILSKIALNPPVRDPLSMIITLHLFSLGHRDINSPKNIILYYLGRVQSRSFPTVLCTAALQFLCGDAQLVIPLSVKHQYKQIPMAIRKDNGASER